MKSGRVVAWPMVVLIGCGTLIAALTGCSSSGSGLGHHGHQDCPLCKHAEQCPYDPNACPGGYACDPANCIADYHRKQTSRNAWRARNVKYSMY
ncbi:MAG: hypothetical protein WD066_18055 [Planctomycetaceae bacterium]